MSVLDFGLGLAGLPEKTIKDLDAALPALERIAAGLKSIEPTITKLWPDVVAVTPLVIELIAFAKQKESE